MLRELKQKRAKLWSDMQGLNEVAKNEKRSLTEDELKTWDKMEADMKVFDSEIERSKEFDQRAKMMAEHITDNEAKPPEKRSKDAVFGDWVRRGFSGISNDERELIKRGTATQITTTDSLGGYLVPDTWANSIMEQMLYYAPVLDVADVQTTSTGGTFHVPTQDDTASIGAIIGQGVADTVGDLTFGEVALGDYTYTSKLIKASWEQLNDSAYDIQGYINKKVAERIGRKWEVDLTTGTGSAQPQGFITGASSGKVAASTSAITRSEIIDLIYSVDKSYRGPNAVLAMHDTTVAAIRKLTVGSSDDRALWQPSIRDGEPDRIEGFRYVVNNAMAELTDGVNSKVMAFGDFSYFLVRRVGGVELVRLNERFADARAVGFFAYARMDAKVLNSSAIKYLALAAA